MSMDAGPSAAGPEDLPDEVSALQARVRELQSFVTFFCLCYGQLHQTHQDLLRRLYGARSQKLKTVLKNLKSGKANEPGAEADVAPVADPSAAARDQPRKPRKPGGGGRREPPAHLPIVREVIDLPEDQKTGLVWVRNETTNQLAYRPSLFYLHRIVRPVYASPAREHPPRVMPLPAQVIPQASVHVSFIVHTILAKYCDHIPYHRQEQIDLRGGVFIARQARYRYAMAGANLLMTIRDGLKHMILGGGYIQIDETFAALIDPDRQGRTRTCYLWGYHSPKLNACVMEFSLSRSGVILEEFFENSSFDGVIQSDGARMYTRFIKKNPAILHLQCMQHLRQYLIEALKANETQALPLLEQISQLYAIEEEAEARGFTDEQRGHWRHAKAKPILKRLQKRFLQLKGDPTLFGNLRKAVIYAIRRWRELARYARVDRGHLLIDNNTLEALWRPVKVGAKNWLFIGHPAAGWVSAVLYSIMATCRLLKINPEAYLTWVLPKLAAMKGARAYQGLLPHDFARLQAEQAALPVPDPIHPLGAVCTARRSRAAPCDGKRRTRSRAPLNHHSHHSSSGASTQTHPPPR